MILLPRRQIVIVTPPKAASLSLHAALCTAEHGGQYCVGPSILGDACHHTMAIPSACAGWRVLCPWRDPLDRLVSLYCHYVRTEGEYHGRWCMAWWDFANRIGRGESLPLDHAEFYSRTQAEWVRDVKIDMRLRYDAIETDLRAEGIDCRLPRENTSHRRPCDDYYDDSLREVVRKWASADLDSN